MPNRGAKDRKKKRAALNKKLASEGRTANQYKKWLAKQKDKPQQFGLRRWLNYNNFLNKKIQMMQLV